MDILTLKQKIPTTYFDYQRLKNAISGQVNKRRYIGQLITKGYIVRVKKGLYIWGNELNPAGYSKMILANLLFGPSYVSLEYALSHYGMIPERVETVTSITFKKNKSFSTPVGHFEYRYLHQGAYAIGVKLVFVHQQETALIAAPEKALLDTIALRVKKIAPETSLDQLLYEDLRIDHDLFAKLSTKRMLEYAVTYKSTAIKQFIKKLGSGNG